MSGAAIGSTGSFEEREWGVGSASIASVGEVAAAAASPPPHSGGARPSAKSVSFAMGRFPRVLPFSYLGNLTYASNAYMYMLHALGITHVVSVGECATRSAAGTLSLTADSCTSAACRIEEREGWITVLDIKGVCALEPQMEPICEWIEKARQECGQVLVHCRVECRGIAYMMKHLSLPLVDAYLIVRSRRLSLLIQPNMRLLYNLCGWEIKLGKERAQGDEARLRKDLARTLTWPYLAKETTTAYLNTAISPDLGTIKVDFCLVQVSRKKTDRKWYVRHEPRILHERSKKGMGHSIQFGPEFHRQNNPSKMTASHTIQSMARFNFKYRPIELLRAEGIAPLAPREERAATPPNVVDLSMEVDEDDAEEAEIKKLEMKLEALKNKRQPKQVKREASFEVKKEIKREGPIFLPGEVIDLT
ncbi:hypothetical protein C8F04DRAFT_1364360 [Mycena alexandri]|uniref:Tyrosine-protein phosphatase domain-containing protein n=1 Tax=Mycena alexandri TaxID=1745969 RepID=A0AAD6RVM2_9AGAR|nr:hypothetical protein C8F04DRAFT_1364360 [Mycena alexandri]